MTDENRKRNLLEELARAEQALRAAEALRDLGLFSDAVSRAYYGVFHILRAVLVSRAIEPKTHSGAIHLFNTEIIRPGLLPSAHNKILGGLQRARELADYDAAIVFSREDVEAFLSEARSFENDVRALLAREGWIPPAE